MLDNKSTEIELVASLKSPINWLRRLYSDAALSSNRNAVRNIPSTRRVGNQRVRQMGGDVETYFHALRKHLHYQQPFPLFRYLGMLEVDPETLWHLLALHMPHVDPRDPTKVLFFPTWRNLVTGRPVTTTVGRYLRKLVGTTNEQISQAHSAWLGEGKVQFIENFDSAGWRTVYDSPKVRSCMAGKSCIRMYAGESYGVPNGLRLAYMGDSADMATSRAIVRSDKKEYIRVYGDSSLSAELEALGYVDGNFDGLKFPVISRSRTSMSMEDYAKTLSVAAGTWPPPYWTFRRIMVPYMDRGHVALEIEGDEMYLVSVRSRKTGDMRCHYHGGQSGTSELMRSDFNRIIEFLESKYPQLRDQKETKDD